MPDRRKLTPREKLVSLLAVTVGVWGLFTLNAIPFIVGVLIFIVTYFRYEDSLDRDSQN